MGKLGIYMENFILENTSAIFGLLGTIVGGIGTFFSTYFFKKYDRKNEISKEEAKEYFKQKRIVLNESLKLISKYELIIETLHDFYEDNNGVPVKMITKEDIYSKYFLKIFGYLHSHRLYLEEDTIKRLDSLKKDYFNFLIGKKIILVEFNDDEKYKSLESLKNNLYTQTVQNFDGLNKKIKYDEIQLFKNKVTT